MIKSEVFFRQLRLQCDADGCLNHTSLRYDPYVETLAQAMREKHWSWTVGKSSGPSDHYCPAHRPKDACE